MRSILLILIAFVWLACAAPKRTTTGERTVDSAVAPNANHDVAAHLTGDTLTVRVGDYSEQLRYVETSRVVEEFNYPSVLARIETSAGDLVLEVNCHDSYDDCGTDAEDLSCPVVEESTIEFAQLRALHQRLGAKASAVALVDAIGAATPIAACMARFNESEPELVWLFVEGSFEAPEEVVDALYGHVTAAQESWSTDPSAAIARMEKFQTELEAQEPNPEVAFAVSYGLEQLRANADDAYVTPITGPGGAVVDGAGELLHVYWRFVEALREWQGGEPFPRPSSRLLRESDPSVLPGPVRAALTGEVERLYQAGAGYVAHVVFENTDDAWLFVLRDGRVLQQLLFSSRDNAPEEAWERPE